MFEEGQWGQHVGVNEQGKERMKGGERRLKETLKRRRKKSAFGKGWNPGGKIGIEETE